MKRQPDKLEALRRQIDALDQELLELLAQRLDRVREIGVLKQQLKLPPLDADRWQTVLKTRQEVAKALGLPTDFTARLYELIHDYALKLEAKPRKKSHGQR